MEKRFMGKRYAETCKVSCYETDRFMQLRPFSILNYAQEIAYVHSTGLGVGWNALMDVNLVWVLSRIRVKILDFPHWRDEIEMETWHKGQDRMFSLRDFVISDKKGNAKVLITSSWLIIDVNTRRIHRFENLMKHPDDVYEYIFNKDAIYERADKILLPEDMTLVKTREVVYSDVDFNGHVNNAKYIEWSEDIVPPQMQEKMRLSEFSIEFCHECRQGETIELYMKICDVEESTEKKVYVSGRREGKAIYSALLKYVPVA